MCVMIANLRIKEVGDKGLERESKGMKIFFRRVKMIWVGRPW
jgi:hypothetical protein